MWHFSVEQLFVRAAYFRVVLAEMHHLVVVRKKGILQHDRYVLSVELIVQGSGFVLCLWSLHIILDDFELVASVSVVSYRKASTQSSYLTERCRASPEDAPS